MSCEGDKCDQVSQYANVEVDIAHESLVEPMTSFASSENAVAFLKKNTTMANYFLDANQYPNLDIIGRRVYGLFQQASLDTLIWETQEYFGDVNERIIELENAYRFVKHNYPEVNIPRVQTLVSGLYNDLYVSDSLIVIGLDYFMGEKGRFYPDIPFYMVKRYSKESLVPIIMTFVSNEFNQPDLKSNSLLSEMINIGKSYYFVKQAMPCTPDSLIIGYTSEDMELIGANRETIWANLIENELLYETDHFLKNKFVGERPNTFEISNKCPGRIGAWVGWEIVQSYMENNPDVTIQELMADTDTHTIFQKSKYRPTND